MKEIVLLFLGLVVVVAGIVGWGINVYKFTQCDFDVPYKCELVRGVGIPIPIVGAVAGYMELGK